MSSVHVYRDKTGEWRWKHQATNGEVIAVSGEGYKNKHHAWDMALKLFPGVPVLVPDESDGDDS